MDREYRYRKAFSLTHEQYMDEPAEIVEWMVRIDQIAEEQRRAADAGSK